MRVIPDVTDRQASIPTSKTFAVESGEPQVAQP
jgi:hypothetical protein